MKCYFNLVNGSERIADQEGIEVRDIEQAHAQAVKAIAELREEDHHQQRHEEDARDRERVRQIHRCTAHDNIGGCR